MLKTTFTPQRGPSAKQDFGLFGIPVHVESLGKDSKLEIQIIRLQAHLESFGITRIDKNPDRTRVTVRLSTLNPLKKQTEGRSSSD